ncbi:hypothetical protein KQI38_09435 [Tissierella carlieri]|uniref:DUF6906 family protein n=1 Tax=Tissierella carlieri TaxID=689904 RepID=UPI001C1161E4|nr:hypothetical protein [Tissierella carlieri]MBU5312249.1 hypothetical protein [Tissierella carlieri]
MKRGKRPTRAQKISIDSFRLNPDNWLVIRDCKDSLEIVHKVSGKTRTLKKEA